ncbi:MAG: DUF4382 domain-containing protein [Ginsengibacter sp.]
MKKTQLLTGILLPVLCFCMFSCKKDNSTSQLNVKMTDAPADYGSVNVDVREVWVNMKNDSSGWVELNTNAKIYDLLSLQNGVDTLVANGTVETGTVKEIRFVLGSNNSITVAGITYPLVIPSGEESGLKIKIDKKINATVESLVIDFDAALSVRFETGTYKLRPVLRVK